MQLEGVDHSAESMILGVGKCPHAELHETSPEHFSGVGRFSQVDVEVLGQSAVSVVTCEALAELLIERICPIGAEIERRLAEPEHIEVALAEGARQAREIADDTMAEVRSALGM